MRRSSVPRGTAALRRRKRTRDSGAGVVWIADLGGEDSRLSTSVLNLRSFWPGRSFGAPNMRARSTNGRMDHETWFSMPAAQHRCRDCPLVALAIARRQSDPRQPARASQRGPALGSITSPLTDLWCPVAHVPHLLLRHLLPIVLLGGVGAARACSIALRGWRVAFCDALSALARSCY
jgi:hypothetical protein